MSEITQTAVLGAGVIGASWTALFSAAGLGVNVYDPASDVEDKVTKYIEAASPALKALGLSDGKKRGEIRFFDNPGDAVSEVGFVQENVPERIRIKHQIFAEIEPRLEAHCVVASSASGLMVHEMQEGWKDPSRFLLGHPFNPPHLIPLVELLGNDKTDPAAMDLAEKFYRGIGKVTIRVKKEVPGHVANRLQAALWREAIHLVTSGVASVEDVDKAVWAGPGLRWAAMGPHMLFHLGAGPGGMEEFCNRYTDSFNRWWDDLGELELTPQVARAISDGVSEEASDTPVSELSATRDQLILKMLAATRNLRD